MTWLMSSERRACASTPWRRACASTPRRRASLGAGAALLGLALSAPLFAAETADPSQLTQTRVVMSLDTPEALSIRTRTRGTPPTILIEFPQDRVVGLLPERTAVNTSVIESITTRYQDRPSGQSKRYLRALEIVLKDDYGYRAWSEPGRVIIEVEHPVSIGGATVEVGLRGGTVISPLARSAFDARFQAMQAALSQAGGAGVSRSSAATAPARAAGAGEPGASAPRIPDAAPGTQVQAPAPAGPGSGYFVILGLFAAAVLSLMLFDRIGARRAARAPGAGPAIRPPAVTQFVDQLVWQAFERRGYQLVSAMAVREPSGGLLRIVADSKGGKAGLMCVGNGGFFEKQTVEEFRRTLDLAKLEGGTLVATGAFTIPAQRLAKERRITLIGREQLMELMSAAAADAVLAGRLETSRTELDEAKRTLETYATELEHLRRQRNDASWQLGQERVKSSALESQLATVEDQLRRFEDDLRQWEAEVIALRTQWEESQWFLGESSERVRHLETQLAAMQEAARRSEQAERERDESNWYLAEMRGRADLLAGRVLELEDRLRASDERAQQLNEAARERDDARGAMGDMERQRTELEAKLDNLRQAHEASMRRELALQAAFETLREELHAIRANGERRSGLRAYVHDASIELAPEDAEPVFSGAPLNLSANGMQVRTPSALPAGETLDAALTLPGLPEPVRTKTRIVWQRDASGGSNGFDSGCEFVGIPESLQSYLGQLVDISI
ncbi:MAG TPA: PilZ domain-containing protein [bacterium]